MDRTSYFIKDRALFGSFPTQEAVDELEKEGVKFFINLTHQDEKKITPYTTNYTQILFPIVDRQVPKDWVAYARFIILMSDIILSLKSGELVYLHCKGGHGRSGVVVASLLCYIFGLSPEKSLEQTTKSHSKRHTMREKWRKLGSPQTYYQKNFVYKFFEPLMFYRAYKNGLTAGFSNFTSHPVTIKNFGTFPTSESAIQAYKNPTDRNYVQKQENSKSPIMAKALGRKTELRKDWIEVCNKLMYQVVEAKFTKNPELKENLIQTGLRPIIQHTRGDYFWGDGGDGTGRNKLGKILTSLRESFYREEEV
jgi:ribA/ribD-fused uncharacterized protein